MVLEPSQLTLQQVFKLLAKENTYACNVTTQRFLIHILQRLSKFITSVAMKTNGCLSLIITPFLWVYQHLMVKLSVEEVSGIQKDLGNKHIQGLSIR